MGVRVLVSTQVRVRTPDVGPGCPGVKAWSMDVSVSSDERSSSRPRFNLNLKFVSRLWVTMTVEIRFLSSMEHDDSPPVFLFTYVYRIG